MKVMLYSNGIGPLRKRANQKKARKIIDKVDLITLRDECSGDVLREIGVTNNKVTITADPALTLDMANETRGREILCREGVEAGKKLLGVSIRRWQNLNDDFEETVARVCDYAYEKYGYHTVLLPMQPSRDAAILQNVQKLMKHKSTLIKKRYGVEDMLSIIKCFNLCIGMRLHTLIYSAINSIPLIGLVYDPKISSFMEHTHQRHYFNVNNVTERDLCSAVDDCIKNHDAISEDLSQNYERLKALAQKNGRYAVELYEKGSVELE